jgi:DnaJ-class molecular chaperone
MKNLIIIIIFLSVPLITLLGQDKNAVQNREVKTVNYCTKEVDCPECQGWGWLISLTYKLGNDNSKMSSSDRGQFNIRNNGNLNTILQKVKCYYCGGTGKIRIKLN